MEDKQEYYESREDMNQGIKDANTVNLDNPEQKEIIRKCNENIEYLRTSDLPKDETLKRIDNIIEGYEFDLIESQRSKTETYIIDGKRYERKLFNEKLLILIISRYEAFKKRIESLPDKVKQPENENWFKVGLLFATGEMDLLKEYNSTKIAKEKFGKNFKGFRPYISSSRYNQRKSDKNIFSSKKKMRDIIDYCNKHKITIAKSFMNEFQSIS